VLALDVFTEYVVPATDWSSFDDVSGSGEDTSEELSSRPLQTSAWVATAGIGCSPSNEFQDDPA
jgi:hypothetical protein